MPGSAAWTPGSTVWWRTCRDEAFFGRRCGFAGRDGPGPDRPRDACGGPEPGDSDRRRRSCPGQGRWFWRERRPRADRPRTGVARRGRPPTPKGGRRARHSDAEADPGRRGQRRGRQGAGHGLPPDRRRDGIALLHLGPHGPRAGGTRSSPGTSRRPTSWTGSRPCGAGTRRAGRNGPEPPPRSAARGRSSEACPGTSWLTHVTSDAASEARRRSTPGVQGEHAIDPLVTGGL